MGYNKIAKKLTRTRKHHSIRKKIHGTSDIPRLVVFKSNRNIFAQLADDDANKTLAGVSSLSVELKDSIQQARTRADVATAVGKAIAEKAKKIKVKKVVFDRGGYLYHGLVKALADGARESGLKF